MKTAATLFWVWALSAQCSPVGQPLLLNHCAPVYTNGLRLGWYCWRAPTPVQAAVLAVSNGVYTFKPPLRTNQYNLILNATNVTIRRPRYLDVEPPPMPK